MVSCRTEASQSGVVALALGAGMPSIVTPVGGLPSQMIPGVTGLVVEAISGEAVAAAMETLIIDPQRVESRWWEWPLLRVRVRSTSSQGVYQRASSG